jgi:hypothetical protein
MHLALVAQRDCRLVTAAIASRARSKVLKHCFMTV